MVLTNYENLFANVVQNRLLSRYAYKKEFTFLVFNIQIYYAGKSVNHKNININCVYSIPLDAMTNDFTHNINQFLKNVCRFQLIYTKIKECMNKKFTFVFFYIQICYAVINID